MRDAIEVDTRRAREPNLPVGVGYTRRVTKLNDGEGGVDVVGVCVVELDDLVVIDILHACCRFPTTLIKLAHTHTSMKEETFRVPPMQAMSF